MKRNGIVHVGAFMTIASLVVIVVGAVMAHRQERRLATYVEAEATILSKRIDTSTSTSKGRTSTKYHPVVEYEYTVAGRTYRSSQLGPSSQMSSSEDFADAVMARFRIGWTYPSWHDPDAPSEAFLLRETSFMPYVFIVVVAPFFAMGLWLWAAGVEAPVGRQGGLATAALATTGAFVIVHYRYLADGAWTTLSQVCIAIHLVLFVPTALVSLGFALADRRPPRVLPPVARVLRDRR